MAFSKAHRIFLLLVIDIVFFLVELIIGQYAHSLALVADSFHMLNDVLSLVVALWAVRIAESKPSAKMTYGWQRAETLGALINGVFLIALCVSILLEAIQRFVKPPTISQPVLILVVGCVGFTFNILGLFLFHDHGHEHDHHSKEDAITAAEHGHAHYDREEEERRQIANPNGNVADVMPQSTLGTWQKPNPHRTRQSTTFARELHKSDETGGSSPRPRPVNGNIPNRHRRRTSGSFGRGFGSLDNINIHPASFRHDIIAAGRRHSESGSESEDSDYEEEEAVIDDPAVAPDSSQTNQNLKLLTSNGSPVKLPRSRTRSRAASQRGNKQDHRHDSWHTGHNHAKPPEPSSQKSGHGHSHGDLNMRGVFLHVMGDALGNLAVIASALFIWLTDFSWRFYSDPAISLVITIIILLSAIPLCRSAARILLQAVPNGMSVDDIKDDIEALPGVISCHHLHVWQLSETKYIGSLHVKVDCEVEGSNSNSYMHLAGQIRRCLHEFGIHSSTIQPEFCSKVIEEGESSESTPILATTGGRDFGTLSREGNLSRNSSIGRRQACLLECVDECAPDKQCCGVGKEGDGIDGKKT